jgi:hypothetical protein
MRPPFEFGALASRAQLAKIGSPIMKQPEAGAATQ